MSDSDFFSLKELLDEYLSRLESSKEKDPRKNKLLLEIKEKLSIAAGGQHRVDLYEKYLPLTFIEYWKETQFDKFLEEYEINFNKRLEASTDKGKLFEIEIKSLEIKDLNSNTLTDDITKDGEYLGYLIAINGDNPNIYQLVYHLTKYEFGINVHTVEESNDFFDDEYWNSAVNSYQQIFRKLHWVCNGYLNAKKLELVKGLKFKPQEVLNNELSHAKGDNEKLSNKQQVLLIHKLGILELPSIQNLSLQNQGKLFGRLFGKNEKNTEDYIRYRHGKNIDKKYSLNLPEVQKAVSELLKEIGHENL
jgi:hypothetical protein